jgi:hypothetical protein
VPIAGLAPTRYDRLVKLQVPRLETNSSISLHRQELSECRLHGYFLAGCRLLFLLGFDERPGTTYTAEFPTCTSQTWGRRDRASSLCRASA